MTDDLERRLAIELARNDIRINEEFERKATADTQRAFDRLQEVQRTLADARSRLADLLDGAPIEEAGKR